MYMIDWNSLSHVLEPRTLKNSRSKLLFYIQTKIVWNLKIFHDSNISVNVNDDSRIETNLLKTIEKDNGWGWKQWCVIKDRWNDLYLLFKKYDFTSWLHTIKQIWLILPEEIKKDTLPGKIRLESWNSDIPIQQWREYIQSLATAPTNYKLDIQDVSFETNIQPEYIRNHVIAGLRQENETKRNSKRIDRLKKFLTSDS